MTPLSTLILVLGSIQASTQTADASLPELAEQVMLKCQGLDGKPYDVSGMEGLRKLYAKIETCSFKDKKGVDAQRWYDYIESTIEINKRNGLYKKYTNDADAKAKGAIESIKALAQIVPLEGTHEATLENCSKSMKEALSFYEKYPIDATHYKDKIIALNNHIVLVDNWLKQHREYPEKKAAYDASWFKSLYSPPKLPTLGGLIPSIKDEIKVEENSNAGNDELDNNAEGNTDEPTENAEGNTDEPTENAEGNTGEPTENAEGNTGEPTENAEGNTGEPTENADLTKTVGEKASTTTESEKAPVVVPGQVSYGPAAPKGTSVVNSEFDPEFLRHSGEEYKHEINLQPAAIDATPAGRISETSPADEHNIKSDLAMRFFQTYPGHRDMTVPMEKSTRKDVEAFLTQMKESLVFYEEGDVGLFSEKIAALRERIAKAEAWLVKDDESKREPDADVASEEGTTASASEDDTAATTSKNDSTSTVRISDANLEDEVTEHVDAARKPEAPKDSSKALGSPMTAEQQREAVTKVQKSIKPIETGEKKDEPEPMTLAQFLGWFLLVLLGVVFIGMAGYFGFKTFAPDAKSVDAQPEQTV